MSEQEKAERRIPGRAPTAADLRALAGPATPHFALQVRNRIRKLIEPLPATDPVRAEGERQIARLEALADFTGEPRSGTGAGH